ncbi:MAG: DUF169 domain-containing protein [Chloroflexota bacterium]|nr:DUF169 domain-containing protein [Chloroflexota bacterium]
MELTKITQALDLYIRPQTFPIAVRMVSSIQEIPEKARMPKRDLGIPLAACQGLALARRYGWLIAMSGEDMLCPLGALTLGFVPVKAKFLDGSFDIPFWVKDQDIRAKVAQALPRLESGKYSHLLAAPIHRANFEPQVIVVYASPAQIARLIQAAVYGTGRPVVSSSTGGFACGEEITRTMLSDECQFIVTGGGDRTIAQAQDHEAVFAMPASKVEAIVEGLEGTHSAGMRYPTPSFLTFKAQFPPAFDELMDYLKQSS